MKIEDVSHWFCNGNIAVAITSNMREDMRSWQKWANDPANQPKTALNGLYKSEDVEMKEVWEFRMALASQPFRKSDKYAYLRHGSFEQFTKTLKDGGGLETRLSHELVLKEKEMPSLSKAARKFERLMMSIPTDKEPDLTPADKVIDLPNNPAEAYNKGYADSKTIAPISKMETTGMKSKEDQWEQNNKIALKLIREGHSDKYISGYIDATQQTAPLLKALKELVYFVEQVWPETWINKKDHPAYIAAIRALKEAEK